MNSLKPDWTEDWFNRRLKTVSLNDIEAAISTALGELVGDTYSVRIVSLEFDPNAFSTHKASMSLTIERPSPWETSEVGPQSVESEKNDAQ